MSVHLSSIDDQMGRAYIFELSGEHKSLPKAEILACFEAQGTEYKVKKEDEGVLVVDAPKLDVEEIKNRLALTHGIDNHIFSCEADELRDLKRPIPIEEGSFAVRAKRIRRLHESIHLKNIEKILADNVSGENEVDLLHPDIEIRVIISNNCHIGTKLAKINRSAFEKRKVQFRPYFSPVSLHPKLARVLVNLSRVKVGQRLLDPFCGTGGVLIEAALVGARTMGSDIDLKMVEGCKKNLLSLGIEDVDIFCMDIKEVEQSVKEVDAIATDPPYGRSATTNREEISSLFERAFKTFSKILAPGGYASVVVPDKSLRKIGENFLCLKESYAMRVHKSLTRNFCVYRKE